VPAPCAPRPPAAAAQRCRNTESLTKTNFKVASDTTGTTTTKLCFKLSASRTCDAATTCCFASAGSVKALHLTNVNGACLGRPTARGMVVSLNGSPRSKKARRAGSNLNLQVAASLSSEASVCVDVSGVFARKGGWGRDGGRRGAGGPQAGAAPGAGRLAH
jgi:hypothetical protein